jgi:tetratricopeptide (TPR) repeat protein
VGNLDAAEHLKVARRLHFQGLTDEAIREYELVLEIDPDNDDAAAGLRSLGVEPRTPSAVTSAVEHAGGLKTSFFANQAKEADSSSWQKGPFKIIAVLVGLGIAWGAYQLVMMLLNFENIKAMENVDAHISKVKTDGEGHTVASLKISNYNPAPIKDMTVYYQLMDVHGNPLKDGRINISTAVPPGDTRTFSDIDLGTVKERADKIEQKLELLKYGPKPKLAQRLQDKFIEASSKPDKENFSDFDELTQDADGFSPALVGMGRAYAARSDWKRAMEQYKKALDIDPENYNAHYYMATAMYYAGDKAGAKQEMDKATAIAPDDPQISWSLKYLFSLKEPKGKGAQGPDSDAKDDADKDSGKDKGKAKAKSGDSDKKSDSDDK